MVRVKICGITNWADARSSVGAGADALGFNFYAKSPRYISPADARAIIRRLPRNVLTVGVFVNEPFGTILKIARKTELNLLQLHGEESPDEVRRLGQYRPVLKAFRVDNGFKLNRLARFREASAFLLDGYDVRLRGGTGRMFDWRVGRAARKYGAIIIAGGLTPENVGEAIATVEPFAVDVCSGVEASPGRKDPARIQEFMRAMAGARRKKS